MISYLINCVPDKLIKMKNNDQITVFTDRIKADIIRNDNYFIIQTSYTNTNSINERISILLFDKTGNKFYELYIFTNNIELVREQLIRLKKQITNKIDSKKYGRCVEFGEMSLTKLNLTMVLN